MKNKRLLILIPGALVLLLAAGGAYLWYLFQKPLYEPGMLRAGQNLGAPLIPPAQPAGEADFWLVEDGIRLHHFSDGQGSNVLVIHGGPGMPFTQPVAAFQPLSGQYRFNYYDQRGCGGSTRPIQSFATQNSYQNMLELDRKLGLEAQLADIERIRQLLGEEKLILVGHSFGGFLATLYAAEFPEHVRGLVLIAPATMLVMPFEGDDLFDSVKPLLPPEKVPAYEAYLARYFDFSNMFSLTDADLAARNNEFAQYYSLAAQAKGFDISTSDALAAADAQATGGWMVMGMYISMGQRHDYRPALKNITAPALVLHGDLDLQSEAASRAYADLLPNARFQVISGAGHAIFIDQPEAFAAAVGDFFAQLK